MSHDDEYQQPAMTRHLISFGKRYFEHYDYALDRKLVEQADVVFAVEPNLQVRIIKVKHATFLFDMLRADGEDKIEVLSKGKTMQQLANTDWRQFRIDCLASYDVPAPLI